MGKYQENWNLDNLFSGGSDSAAFRRLLDDVQADLKILEAKWPAFEKGLHPASRALWLESILLFQAIDAKTYSAMSFGYCLISQDSNDEKAYAVYTACSELDTQVKVWKARLEALYGLQPDAAWQDLLADPQLSPVAFHLNHARDCARQKMSPDKEALTQELAGDGYRGWARLYERMAGKLKASMALDGKIVELSMGQLSSKMSHPDRAVRQSAFEKLEACWETVKQETAMALNHLAGFRQTMYRHRGWDWIVEEALQINRVSRQTIETMWQVIGEENSGLAPYFEYKAKLLGVDKLSWFDITAPVGTSDRTFTYDQACDLVIDQLATFGPDLSAFARMAIEQRWIEAEDRSNKRAGAYSTGFPTHDVTRVFMTFTGTFDNLSTLAHELGHSYHSWVMRDLPFFSQVYPMTLAETASTFNETVVDSGALSVAQSDAEKLFLLDSKLSSAVSFFMNLKARYLFELDFYEARKAGFVDPDRLNQIMAAAQKKAYCNLLDEKGLHPLFWASKHHFYFADEPFYNFPYTFGFLFSNGIYHHAQSMSGGFADGYIALLRDTGRLTCEEVARKHLGVDISQPDFWRKAVHQVLSAVGPFVELAKKQL